MIDAHQSRTHTSRRLWSGTIQRLFQTLELQDHTAAPEISESLAVFCQEQPRMPGRSLSLLMARSFCVIGDSEAAGRILRHDRAHRPHADTWLNVLTANYPFPELYPLFSARVLRPQDLNSVGRAWVLDFDAVDLSEADRHELILFQTVRVLTCNVSNVWKKSNGQGALGIKGLRRLTNFMRPRGVEMSAQLFDHIRDVLTRCANENGWEQVPAVLQIDL